jgi:hypothetical protein
MTCAESFLSSFGMRRFASLSNFSFTALREGRGLADVGREMKDEKENKIRKG